MALSATERLSLVSGHCHGPVLFIIFISYVDVGPKNLISKFADDTHISKSVLTDEENLHIISAWSDRREMPLNIGKCHILQVGINNKYDYEMCGAKPQRAQCQGFVCQHLYKLPEKMIEMMCQRLPKP